MGVFPFSGAAVDAVFAFGGPAVDADLDDVYDNCTDFQFELPFSTGRRARFCVGPQMCARLVPRAKHYRQAVREQPVPSAAQYPRGVIRAQQPLNASTVMPFVPGSGDHVAARYGDLDWFSMGRQRRLNTLAWWGLYFRSVLVVSRVVRFPMQCGGGS